jgi:hypothetical protein
VSDQSIAGENCIAETEAALTELEIVRTIKVLVSKGDKAKEKAEQFYIAAGQHLTALKEAGAHKASGMTWDAYVSERCKIGKSRAHELMLIADGRATNDEVKEQRRVRQRKAIAHKKPPSNDGGNTPTDTTTSLDQEEYQGDDAQTVWRRGLIYRAQSAAADAAYEDWSNFEIDQEAIDMVLDAAKAWADLGKYLQRMTCRARAISAPAAEPLVDDGIPEFLRRAAS